MTFAPRPSPISKCSLPRKIKTQRMRNGEGLEPRLSPPSLATCARCLYNNIYILGECLTLLASGSNPFDYLSEQFNVSTHYDTACE